MEHRTIGMLPISVGTSLALEPFLVPGHMAGELRGTPQMDTLMLNISTMIRNVVQAYETRYHGILNIHTVHADVIEDLSAIYDTLGQLAKIKPDLVLYDRQYTSIPRQYPRGNVWTPSTDSQKKYAALEKGVIMMLHQTLKQFLLKTEKIPSSPKSVYVMTHHPVDLADHPTGFKDINLLESHTGAVKGFELWYTKLTGGKELDKIPFNKLTLQVFGDKSTDFKANKFLYKQTVLSLAEQFNWTPVTTTERVKLGLSTIKDSDLRHALTSMLG